MIIEAVVGRSSAKGSKSLEGLNLWGVGKTVYSSSSRLAFTFTSAAVRSTSSSKTKRPSPLTATRFAGTRPVRGRGGLVPHQRLSLSTVCRDSNQDLPRPNYAGSVQTISGESQAGGR